MNKSTPKSPERGGDDGRGAVGAGQRPRLPCGRQRRGRGAYSASGASHGALPASARRARPLRLGASGWGASGRGRSERGYGSRGEEGREGQTAESATAATPPQVVRGRWRPRGGRMHGSKYGAVTRAIAAIASARSKSGDGASCVAPPAARPRRSTSHQKDGKTPRKCAYSWDAGFLSVSTIGGMEASGSLSRLLDQGVRGGVQSMYCRTGGTVIMARFAGLPAVASALG